MRRIKLKPCPYCGNSGKNLFINRIMFSGSIFDKHLFYVECPHCHWCGKVKLFRRRAIKAWNRSTCDGRQETDT